MFTIPPIGPCERYRHEVLDLERRFKKANRSLPEFRSILQPYFSDGSLSSPQTGNVRVAVFFPYWSAENYQLEEESKQTIILAGIYYAEYFLIEDTLIDTLQIDRRQRSSLWILANIFFMRAMQTFCEVFASDSDFLISYIPRCTIEYWETVGWESSYGYRARSWSEKEIRKLGKKLSPLKVITTALALLGGQKRPIPELAALIENYHVGMQMIDDIDDWKEDLVNRNFTFFLSNCASDMRTSRPSYRQIIRKAPKSALARNVETSARFLKDSKNLARRMRLQSLEEFLSILLFAVDNLYAACEHHPGVVMKEGASKFLSVTQTQVESACHIA
jgi:hypothetical protein